MKNFLFLLLLAVPCFAQPNSVGVSAFWGSGSRSSGNTPAIGICAEATHDAGSKYAVLTGSACYDTGDKGYVGDGHNLRGKLEGHAYFSRNTESVRPFLLVGVNYARQSNSQYSKAITNYYGGGGINFRDRVIVQAAYLLPESGTLNQVSAIWASGYWLRPVAAKWSLKLGGGVSVTRFYQPGGPLTGWHRSSSVTITGGILRTNNARIITSAPPIVIPPPKPRAQYAAVQSFTTGYGAFKIVNPL